MESFYDVIVIGAGHAGCEAAFAAANLGSKTMLLATSLQCVAMMPCNPSVGGPGKGHLVREIHALGGQIASQVDATYLQIRMLNESRGPAVRALRAQSDKLKYHLHVKEKLETHANIHLMQGEVCDITPTDKELHQVTLVTGVQFTSACVILCTGTFLNGAIILGHSKNPGGPAGHTGSYHLSPCLQKLGIQLRRLQTATPPRVLGSTIHFDRMKPMPGDIGISTFSNDISRPNQRNCYLTHTTKDTIAVVEKNLVNSPLKIGNITQHGPKHCPSIDRKVIRFPELETHHVFVEPESDLYDEWYLLGLTTSMPPEAQEAILRTVPGLEDAQITRYGYAIEYDSVDATQLKKTLEFKSISGLFAAGQINGTSGYEEAAAQGLIAGINAHRKAHGLPPFSLKSTTSYLAEMIDELVTNPRNEPLRVTTSSSEFRLHLRSDNAEERLTQTGFELGLVSQERYRHFQRITQAVTAEVERLQRTLLRPTREAQATLQKLQSAAIKNPTTLANLMSREEITYSCLTQFGYPTIQSREIASKVEITIKYDFFLRKLQKKMKYLDELDSLLIDPQLYHAGLNDLPLSAEAKEKLQKVMPYSVGQASKISGMMSSDLAILINHCKNFTYEHRHC